MQMCQPIKFHRSRASVVKLHPVNLGSVPAGIRMSQQERHLAKLVPMCQKGTSDPTSWTRSQRH